MFDTGVNAYTQGVDQILAGTQQLSSASLLLVAGAHQLYTETSNMQLDEELGSLLDTLSAPGVPASFTSDKNTVSALQFALQTEPIQPDAAAAAEQAPAHEPSGKSCSICSACTTESKPDRQRRFSIVSRPSA